MWYRKVDRFGDPILSSETAIGTTCWLSTCLLLLESLKKISGLPSPPWNMSTEKIAFPLALALRALLLGLVLSTPPNSANILSDDRKCITYAKEAGFPLLTTGLNNARHEHGLWIFFPHAADEKWIMLGELDKIVVASPQRFQSVLVADSGISMVLSGAPDELVRLWAINPAQTVSYLEVQLSAQGTAQAKFST